MGTLPNADAVTKQLKDFGPSLESRGNIVRESSRVAVIHPFRASTCRSTPKIVATILAELVPFAWPVALVQPEYDEHGPPEYRDKGERRQEAQPHDWPSPCQHLDGEQGTDCAHGIGSHQAKRDATGVRL
jgi:hypothetical protein